MSTTIFQPNTRPATDRPSGPLAGVRVIDAASLAAAPLAATYLAEFGAEVVKIEQPGAGDPMRHWGSQKDGIGLMWKSISRNKKTMTIDLRVAAGQHLLKDLVRQADVIIFNTRISTLQRWGLTFDDLREVNPQLVMLHVSAYGSGGPKADFPGFGTLGEAMSGFAHTTGEKDGPPTLPSFMLADCVASLNAAFAIMVALYHRDLHKADGQLIDVNLIEPLARMLEHSILTYDQLGRIDVRAGNRWDISAPRNAYRTKDDKWIAMSGSAPSIAMRAFKAIGRVDLTNDPEYSDAQGRLRHGDEIDRLMADWIADRTQEEALAVFEREHVAAAPIYDAEQLINDDHLNARDAYPCIEDDQVGRMRVQAPVARLSDTPARIEHLGKRIGADNDSVLTEWLGMSESDIAKLCDDHVI